MSGYPCEWRANSDAAGDKSGVGKFIVEGVTYHFAMSYFADFHKMGEALDAAFQSGMAAGKARSCDLMRRVIKELGETP